MLKPILSVLFVSLTLTSTQLLADASSEIDAASSAKKAAASVGGEWRDTGKLIKAAKKANAKGDEAGAIKLAKAAQVQGELGKVQAMQEKNKSFPPSYVK